MGKWSKPPIEIAREIFTEVARDEEGDNWLSYVIWNFTGWSEFWHGDAEVCFRQQLQEYHDDPEGVEKRQQEELDGL